MRIAGGSSWLNNFFQLTTTRAQYLFDEGAHVEGGEARFLRRLHHDRVAASQRRGDLPGEHDQGHVPGDYLSDDAYGFVPRVSEELPV